MRRLRSPAFPLRCVHTVRHSCLAQAPGNHRHLRERRIPSPGSSWISACSTSHANAAHGRRASPLLPISRVILFTGQPVLAASIVFAIFLIGSGVGSAMAPEVRTRRAALQMFAVIGMGFVIAATALWLATDVLLEPSMSLRLTLIIMLILPLAWAMGRPFPWALRQFADQPRWIPWVWAVNGFASVAAASLAPLISVHHGQPVSRSPSAYSATSSP
jgi:hypothetical protein